MIKQIVSYVHPPIKPWIIMDIKGLELSTQERWMLKHPWVAGVVLNRTLHYGAVDVTSRAYYEYHQLKSLTEEIKSINPNLILMIDHEGGDIIRFKSTITQPIMKYHPNLSLAYNRGCEVGRCLRDLSIDILLGPVVDEGVEGHAIARRAISADISEITTAASEFIRGVHSSGILTVLKHFPGIGYAEADTHQSAAYDHRDKDAVLASASPFFKLLNKPCWVMTSHVIYSCVDTLPVSLSAKWIDLLRLESVQPVTIITDDLSMRAIKGSLSDTLISAHSAGNDYVICMHQQDPLSNFLK